MTDYEDFQETIEDKQDEDDYCLWDHEEEDDSSKEDGSGDRGVDWDEE